MAPTLISLSLTPTSVAPPLAAEAAAEAAGVCGVGAPACGPPGPGLAALLLEPGPDEPDPPEGLEGEAAPGAEADAPAFALGPAAWAPGEAAAEGSPPAGVAEPVLGAAAPASLPGVSVGVSVAAGDPASGVGAFGGPPAMELVESPSAQAASVSAPTRPRPTRMRVLRLADLIDPSPCRCRRGVLPRRFDPSWIGVKDLSTDISPAGVPAPLVLRTISPAGGCALSAEALAVVA